MSNFFRSEIKDLVPYKPGKPIEEVRREYGLDRIVKLASNESPIGCSPKAQEALNNAMKSLNLAIYPDGSATALKEALAKKCNISPDEVQPSNGADEMIDTIAKTFISHGDEIITADITFPRYMTTAKMMGGIPKIVPLKNYSFDLDGMLKAITPKTKLIWICNPNNPTGTMLTEKEVVSFIEKVPQNIIVIYDEAYRDFVTRDDYTRDSVDLMKKFSNVIVMRTLSKAYGLAALRIGYTIASKEIIDNLNKVRPAFNVNAIAQIAAMGALEDDEFVKKIYDVNFEGKKYLYGEFEKMGLLFPPSETNHIFVDVKKDAQEVFVELQKKGVIIRPMGGTCIRVSIGTPEENAIFIDTLKDVLE
jgi:histidinol-phosphate aminotransferase